VVRTTATTLTVGAGQAFRADRGQARSGEASLLSEHAQAGETLRLVVIAITVALLPRRQRARAALAVTLRVAVAALPVASIFLRHPQLGVSTSALEKRCSRSGPVDPRRRPRRT
jgi:hypothetical protein